MNPNQIHKIIDKIEKTKSKLKSNSAINCLIKAQNNLYDAIREEEFINLKEDFENGIKI